MIANHSVLTSILRSVINPTISIVTTMVKKNPDCSRRQWYVASSNGSPRYSVLNLSEHQPLPYITVVREMWFIFLILNSPRLRDLTPGTDRGDHRRHGHTPERTLNPATGNNRHSWWNLSQ